MIIYYNKAGQIKMISEEPIETSLLYIEKDLTEEELDKIKDINWNKKIKRKKLVLEESEESLKKKETIDKVNNVKNIDELKNIIIDLI